MNRRDAERSKIRIDPQALFSTYAVMFSAQHTPYLIEEPGFGRRLLHRLRSVGGIHANRVFSTAFSVPSNLNELIGLKDDKGRRRIGVFDTVFRRSTSS